MFEKIKKIVQSNYIKIKDMRVFRMLQWFLLSQGVYWVAVSFAWEPSFRTGLLAGGNMMLGAFFAYWVDRTAFITFDRKIENEKTELSRNCRMLCRGLIFAAAIISPNLKLA